MASCRACTARRADAPHWCAVARKLGRRALSDLARGLPSGAGTIRLEYRSECADRYPLGDPKRGCRRRHAAELAALAPDVIFAPGASTVGPLRQVTRSVPIVFAIVADPVGAGFVDSLARPGGNITGFMAFEYAISGKWLELLKQIVPNLSRAAVLRDAAIPTGIAQLGIIQAVAPAFHVEIIQVNLRDSANIEQAIAAFARSSNGGLIITAGPPSYNHRNLIIRLAAERRLPAIYFDRAFVAAGGLISYGPDLIDQYRRAAELCQIASSRARSRPICRCRRRPSSSWLSISRPQKRSASPFRTRCSPAPTRSSSRRDVRYWHKADIASCTAHVRFRG